MSGLKTCEGLSPGNGRKVAHQQKCAALPEPAQRYCAAHMTASGSRRCATCREWLTHNNGSALLGTSRWQCPNSCEVA